MPELLHEPLEETIVVTTTTAPSVGVLSPAVQSDVRDQLVEAAKATEPGVIAIILTQLAIISSLTISAFAVGDGKTEAVLPWLLLMGLTVRSRYMSNRLACTEAALRVNAFNADAVPHLIDMLVWPDDRIRAIVIFKLNELLPCLDMASLPPLGANQRATLHKILDEGRILPSCKVALKVLETYGDEDSLTMVDTIAIRRCWTPGALKLRRAADQSAARLRVAIARRRELTKLQPAPHGNNSDALTQRSQLSPAEAQEQSEQAAIHRAKLEDEAKNRARPALRSAFLIADWVIIVPYTLYEAALSLSSGHLFTTGIWSALAYAAIKLYKLALSPTQSSEARKLAALSDIKSIGTFAEAMDWPDPELQKLAELRLIDMLPILKANDVGLLNSYQRDCLNSALKLGKARDHSNLLIAILKAWEQVGDMKAVPVVEALASGKPRTAWERQVVEAAQQCLPSLRESAFGNQQNLQLLRASSVFAASDEELVRPTMSEDITNPSELLRSGSNE